MTLEEKLEHLVQQARKHPKLRPHLERRARIYCSRPKEDGSGVDEHALTVLLPRTLARIEEAAR